MKKIELFERAIKEQASSLKDWGINHTMFWAYRISEEIGNELIDFHEVIWDTDIEDIARTCRENNIDRFTISSTFSSVIEVLAKFEKCGVKMVGLVEVKAPYKNWQTNENEIIPAIMMKVL